jgi:uncharacterized membrane protein YdjX (TVP38/TMEM64 family)
VVIFIAAYIVVAAFALPGAPVLTMVGGFVFGAVPAAILVDICATIGATLAFLLSRYLVGEWLQARFKDKLGKFPRLWSIHRWKAVLSLIHCQH